jgi:hypothetical protein
MEGNNEEVNTNKMMFSKHSSDKLIKNSFVDKDSLMANKQIEISISPTDLLPEEVPNHLVDPNKDGFLKGFTILDNEGIRCDDKEIVGKQSGIITEVVKQLTFNMFKGLTSLSLPIKVFEPKTQLERDIEWWSYAPMYLKKAGLQKDPVESLKEVTAFVLSALYLSTEQLKPFNPYLGETFQAVFEDGTQVYLEHTCHTPCVSNYLILDSENKYTFSGYFDLATEGALKMVFNNELIVLNKGKGTVHLKESNRTLQIQFPSISISGLVIGQRVVSWRHFLKIEDPSNNLIVLVYFNRSVSSLKKKRVHDFYGGIYSHDFSKDKEKHKQFFEDKIRKEPDAKYKLITIEGSYLEQLAFNGKVYHDFRTTSPCKFQSYFPNMQQIKPVCEYTDTNHLVLPSDSRFREDLIWLKRAFIYKDLFSEYSSYAGKWKLLLEAQQRIDRENRKELKAENEEKVKHNKESKDKKEGKAKKGILNTIFGSKK